MWSNLFEDEGKLKAEKRALEEEIISKGARIEYLLAENQKFKSDVEILEFQKSANTMKIAEMEKARQSLQKDLQKCQETLKYELMARDGLARKSNMFELENIGLKDEYSNVLKAQEIGNQRIKELEIALNDERVKRLRDIHEIDLLKRQNANLQKQGSTAEADALSANTNVLRGLEKAEVLVAQRDMQKRIMGAQEEEAAAMIAELTRMREEIHFLHKEIHRLTGALSDSETHADGLQQDVWRLSKEVIDGSTTQSRKERAIHPSTAQLRDTRLRTTNMTQFHSNDSTFDIFGNSYASMSMQDGVGRSAVPTTATPSVLSLVYDNRFRSAGNVTSSSSMHTPIVSSSSPSIDNTSTSLKTSSRVANLSVSEDCFRTLSSPASQSRLLGQPAADRTSTSLGKTGSDRDINRDVLSSTTSPSPNYSPANEGGGGGSLDDKGSASRAAAARKHNKALQELSVKPKSSFVGCGLGLRQDAAISYEFKGSSKEVLKNILLERGLL